MRASRSAKVGSPPVSLRSTSVLTKNPTRSSSASSVRPAIGVPIGTSVPAPTLVSSADRAAMKTMNGVALWVRASSASRAWVAAPSSNSTAAPW